MKHHITVKALFSSSALILLVGLVSVLARHPLKQESLSIQLEPNQLSRPTLNAAKYQTLTVNLPAACYGQVIFNWEGMDLDVTVRAPGGAPVFASSFPIRGSGSLPIPLISDAEKSYVLEVRSVDQSNYDGNYSVILQDLREPTPLDQRTIEATKTTLEALHQNSKQLTIDRLLAALQIWNSLEEGSGKAFTLQHLGSTYLSAKDRLKAEPEFEGAIQIRQRLGNPRTVAYTLREIGNDYRTFDSPSKGIEYFESALKIAREANDRRAESDLLYSIGYANARIGHMEAAISSYEKALIIQQADNDLFNQARTLNATGGAYDVLGQKTQALDFYQQAADVFDKLQDRYRQAIVINNIALVHDDLGDYQVAREKYEDALAELKSSLSSQKVETSCAFGSPTRMLSICNAMASVLDNLGELSNTLGDPDSALAKFSESNVIRELLNQPQPSGQTLSRICYSNVLLGKPENGLGYCERALELNEKAEDLRGSASTLTFLGMAYAAMNDRAKALTYFERALGKQREAGDRRGEGVTLDKIGLLYATNSKWEDASSQFSRALQLWKDIQDPDGQAITLYDWAKSESERGSYDSASQLVRQAIDIVESTRVRLHSRQLLAGYFANKQNYYELKIDIDMTRAAKSGNSELTESAFHAHEEANARNLLAALNEAKILRAEILANDNPELRSLLQQQQVLSQKLNSKENERRELFSAKHDDETRRSINRAIDKLVDEYDRLDTEIRLSNRRIAELKDPRPSTVSEIQQQLDPDTLLLEFALGEKRSYAWVVTSDKIQGFELAPRAQIETLATRLLHAITERNRKEPNDTPANTTARYDKADKEYADTAAALSKLILAPLAPALQRERLVVVADGALQLVPFGLLFDPSDSSHLIAKHEIVSLPSASVLALQRQELANRKQAPLGVAVVADPVFEPKDPRVADALASANKKRRNKTPVAALPTKPQNDTLISALRSVGADSELQRLVMSRTEAADIARVVPANQLFKALDFQANRAVVMGGALSKYRYVHLATHGVIDLEHPELSGIVLSMVDENGKEQDGYVRLYEIYNLNLPAELVVLSACQTGVGKQIRGEGLMALTRGFMYAGAARVVASLWKVDDSATAALMAQFYKEMFTNGKKPAAALRTAQKYMSEQKRWQSPYYWAGFVLQGEWR